jgi:membrane protease subunit HflC
MLKYRFIAVCGFILGLLLLAFSMTTTVGYNQVAVLATFGSASAEDIKNADGENPGLMFHAFPPFQSVHVFDRRVQVFEERLEEQQTLDGHGVVVSTYVNWRIADPLVFYRGVRNVAGAEQRIGQSLRDARSVIGRFKLAELANPKSNKLAEAEKSILAKMKQLEKPTDESGFGIEILEVGIRKLVLPASATDSVFDRMRSERERLAEHAKAAGDSQARSIKAEAGKNAKRIVSEAGRIADGIRAEGDAEVAKIVSVFKQAPELAIFLRRIDAYKVIFKKYTTFFIDAEQGIGADIYDLKQEAEGRSKRSAPGAKKP